MPEESPAPLVCTRQGLSYVLIRVKSGGLLPGNLVDPTDSESLECLFFLLSFSLFLKTSILDDCGPLEHLVTIHPRTECPARIKVDLQLDRSKSEP